MSNAVVKVNYTRSATNALGSARYYATRANLEGSREARPGFSKETDAVGREEAKTLLGQGEYYYRMVLSPGAARDTLGDTKAWTREVLGELAARQGQSLTWLAYEHAGAAGHSEHAHVHVILVTDHKLNRDDLADLRVTASQSWERHMTYERDISRDASAPIVSAEQTKDLEQALDGGWSL